MDEYLKRKSAVALVLLFLAACPVMAADPGGGGTEEGDSNAMTYITIGIVVVLGGLLALDVISDSGDSDSSEIQPEFENVDTGVDWSQVFPDEPSFTTVAVAVFRGEDGSENSSLLIDELRDRVGGDVRIYAEPVDLGHGDPREMALMAREFFGADLLLLDSGNEGIVQIQAFTPDSMVWTSQPETDIGLPGIVEDLLQAGVF